MPSGSLSCLCVICDRLSERIISYICAGFERGDEAGIFNKDLLSGVFGAPLQECLGSVSLLAVKYCPPGRRICKDRILSFFECVRKHADLEVSGCLILLFIISCHCSADPGALCYKCILAGCKVKDLLIICSGNQKWRI